MANFTFVNADSGQELCAGVQFLDLDAACESAQRRANELGVVVTYFDVRTPDDAYECEPEVEGMKAVTKIETKLAIVCNVAGWDADEITVDGGNVTVHPNGQVLATDRGVLVELGTLTVAQMAALNEVEVLG